MLLRKPSFLITTVIVAVLLLIACFFAKAHADQTYIEGKAGCYQYTLLDNKETLKGNDRPLVINTARPLTVDKTKAVRAAADEKLLTPLGKSIFGRLNKLPDVQTVAITYRQIAVRIFPYPNEWTPDKSHPERKALLNEVLNVIDQVLCGK